MKTGFEKLFEPYRIGRVPTRNRIIKTAAGMGYADSDGHISAKHTAYYGALARGGVGLIIVGTCTVDYPLGIDLPSSLRLHDDKYIGSFSELTRVVHKHGCPIFLQLYHAGPWHPPGESGLQGVSASVLTESELIERMPPHLMGGIPRELSIAEIEEIVEKFVRASERAGKAEFDGVEINVGTCHLGNSFISRAWNKRQDEYGCQSLESRARFAVEIIQKTKKHLGQDFPVTILFNAVEYAIDKGTDIEEGKEFARIFEKAGADAIQVRVYGYGKYERLHWPENVFYIEPPKHLAEGLDWSHRGAGAFIPLAQAIKQVVSVPVFVAGRITPELGEKALRQGKVDFIGLTRSLLADFDLPEKVASGKLDDIAPCTACHHCTSAVGENRPLVCRINGVLGSGEDYTLKRADKKKKVLVIGGGPAGMEAARVAALRGHDVTLYERESRLGGLLPLASMVKGLEIEDLPAIVRYLKTQITRLGVRINLGQEFKTPMIEELGPDVVIVATGGIPAVLEIPGIDRSNVVNSGDLHRKVRGYLRFFGPKTLSWLTKFWMPVGKKVIIIGGDIQGLELAEFLVKRGRKVTVVDTDPEMGKSVPVVNRVALLPWLAKKGVAMLSGVEYVEITDRGMVLNNREGERQEIEADTVVVAVPMMPDTKILETLKGKVPEIYAAGDCRESRLIIDAIADGWRIGRTI